MKIWLHSGSSTSIREFSLPRGVIWGSCLLIAAAIPALTWVGYDYYRLKQTAVRNQALSRDNQVLEGKVKAHRKQIQTFARTIEGLKNKIKGLSDLENRVRVIADIPAKGDKSGLIGIGGIPENNIAKELPLDAAHTSLIREMHEQVKQTRRVADSRKLDFNNLILQLEKKKNMLAAIPSIKPVDGFITSPFGYRKSPFTGRRSFHSGLDIANKSGTKIVATAGGKVSFARRKSMFGNLIMIDHGYGRVTKYAHLKKILVKRGQAVKRGEVIALLGNTGQSTGPHLHYEVVINGTPVNPANYILN